MQIFVIYPFFSSVRRDITALIRRKSDGLMTIAFFSIVTIIFPLGTDINARDLTNFAPGIIWIAILLASILTTDRMFRDDYENGSLEQFIIAPCGLYPIVFAKICSHWCAMEMPLLIFAPLYAYMLGLPLSSLPTLIVVLLLATPILSALGALGAALTVALRHGSVLLALLMLPLYIPLLIFGANAISLAADGYPPDAAVAMLAAMLIVTLLLVPWAVCAALRIVLD